MATLKDVHQYFADRTITIADIDKFHIRIGPPDEIAQRLHLAYTPNVDKTLKPDLAVWMPGNTEAYGHGIFFAGGSPLTPNGFVVEGGKLQTLKLSAKGVQDVVLLPGHDWRAPPKQVLIAESYIKGIVLARVAGPGTAVIVLNGVYGFNDTNGVIKRLTTLPWRDAGVDVVICFDSINEKNTDSKHNVARAVQRLAGIMHLHYGINARDLALPGPPPEVPDKHAKGDWGVDDFVRHYGDAELAKLISTADVVHGVDERRAAVDMFNDQFIMVKSLVKVFELQPPCLRYNKTDFITVYGNRFINVISNRGAQGAPTVRPMKIAEVWLNAEERRTAEKVGFLPGQPRVVNNTFNMWNGLALEPDLSPTGLQEAEEYFAGVIREALEDGAEWFLDALASLVQHPERRTGWYLYLVGEKGTGKGFVTGVLQQVFGNGHAPSLTVENYVNHFNSSKAAARLILVNELPSQMDRKMAADVEAELKQDADPNSHWRPVEHKGSDIVQVERNCTVIFSSNFMPDWSIPWGDRRAGIFRFQDKMAIYHKDMTPWGRKAREWWEVRHRWRDHQDGAAKALGWLMQRDISDFDPEAAPVVTSVKRRIAKGAAGDIGSFLGNLKANPLETLNYMGEALGQYRYFKSAHLAKIMLQDVPNAEVTQNVIVRIGKSMENLGFTSLQFNVKVGANKTVSIRCWHIHGAEEAGNSDIYHKHLVPVDMVLSSSGSKY